MTTIDTLAHLVVFIACFFGALEISRSYVALIHLRWKTRISAKVFFVSVGLTHLGLALNNFEGTFYSAMHMVTAVSLVSFLILLFIDLSRALQRLKLAFKAIRAEYGANGERMIATVIAALQGRNRRNDKSV